MKLSITSPLAVQSGCHGDTTGGRGVLLLAAYAALTAGAGALLTTRRDVA